MGSSPVVVLVDPLPDSAPDASVHAVDLRSYGFDTRVCHDQGLLRVYATTLSSVCFVLGGPLAQSCATAARLRQFSQDAGILVLVPFTDEGALISVFHSGADAYCPATASMALLTAALGAIQRRRTGWSEPVGTVVASPQWVLVEQSWVLVGTAGAHIPLTTGERAFLVALFNAPGMRASHAELVAALDKAYGRSGQPQEHARLGILVTRLRRKCHDYREPLPVKSVHGWGYMFTGSVSDQSLSASE